MKKGKWITIFIVSMAVLAAIVYGFIPKPVLTDMVKVMRGPLKATVEEEGKTRVKDRFTLSAPVPGFMKRLNLKVGDRVVKGQTLVEIEPLRSHLLDPRSRATAEAAVSAAEASLRAEEQRAQAAAADADYAQRNLERMQKLYENHLIAKESYEQSEATDKRSRAVLLSAEAAVEAARSEVIRARTALQYSAADNAGIQGRIVMIKAPVDAGVLKLYRESEGVVQASEPIVDIGDPRKLEVTVEVLSADAVRIKPGMPVMFERWGGNSTLSGTVRIVEPQGFTKVSSLGVEEQRVLVIVDIGTSDNNSEQSLGDGYRLEASFTIWEGKEVLQVPAGALFRKQDGWAVFVVENGMALTREVKVGHRTGLAAEILSGLSVGEEVISHPDNSIEHGIRVRSR
jgi:HlyD family secretion protein